VINIFKMCFTSMQIIALPNQIGEGGYQGWGQERGPSFTGQRDQHNQALTAGGKLVK
jgi:hypothetical protein